MRESPFLIFLILILTNIYAYGKPPVADQVFKLSATAMNNNVIVLNWHIAKNNYLYRNRFKFKIIQPKQAQIGKINLPAGQPRQDAIFGKYQIYTKAITIKIPILHIKTPNTLLQVSYQGCSTAGYCYPPIIHKVNINSAVINITSAQVPQNKITQLLAQGHIFIILLSFLGFGLLLAFTPCVLPMIPILSGIIVGKYKKINTRKAFWLSLTYVLSMAVTYAVFGVVVSLFGKNLQVVWQNRWVLIAFSLLFVFLAMSFFGLFELRLPKKLQQHLTNVSNQQKSGTYLGVVVMGVLATLIVSPCVTPALIGALAYIAKTGNIMLGGSALFMLGLGIGLPLLLVGTVAGKLLPKAGKWMKFINIVFGFFMLLIAVWILMRIVPTTTDIHGLKFQPVQTISQVEKQVTKAKAQHKPVLLDFYANWCVSCKAMDRTTFANPHVQRQLAKFILLRADVTANNIAAQKLEKHFKIVAPPTFIFFDAKGKELIKYQLVGEMGPQRFIQYLKEISKFKRNSYSE